MVLAAGLGLRMRPLSENTPKPLVEVSGRALIDRVFDRLQEAGIELVVVNSHYLAERLEEHVGRRSGMEIRFSREDALLDTGGGVAKALQYFGDEPFFVINADSFWLDGTTNSMARLAAMWDPEQMDALLLLHRTVTAVGFDGPGDYFADQVGKLRRRRSETVAPLAYAGVHILDARALAGRTAEPFSLVEIWDLAEERERLFGQVHDGLWFHVGTPEDVTLAEQALLERRIVVDP